MVSGVGTRKKGNVLNPGHGHGQRTADSGQRTADSGQRTADSGIDINLDSTFRVYFYSKSIANLRMQGKQQRNRYCCSAWLIYDVAMMLQSHS